MSTFDRLAQRKLLVVTGKGGVGKSTIAAVLARRFSRDGRRVLLLDIDPRESVHRALGLRPSGGDILDAGGGLFLQNLTPQSVVDRVVRRRVRFETVAKRVLASPIYEHFTAGAPGLKELAVLGYVVWLFDGEIPEAPEIDLVILDAPATGHGVSLLEAPLLVSEVIGKGPFGQMTGQVAELVGDPERMAVVVATLAEEMPVRESLELAEALVARVGRGPALGIVNGLYPSLPERFWPRDDVDRLWRDRRQLNERELERFRGGWAAPSIELPLVVAEHGPELVEALVGHLSAAAVRGSD